MRLSFYTYHKDFIVDWNSSKTMSWTWQVSYFCPLRRFKHLWWNDVFGSIKTTSNKIVLWKYEKRWEGVSWLRYLHELSSFCKKKQTSVVHCCLLGYVGKFLQNSKEISKLNYSQQLLTNYQIKHLSQWSKCRILSYLPCSEWSKNHL